MTSAFEQIFNAEKAKTEWKPCPFCGGKNEMPHGLWSSNMALQPLTIETTLGNFTTIRCTRCGSNGPPHVSEENALKAWNSRR